MVFSSLGFLYIFLPLCLLLCFALPGIKAKNIALAALSLLFYAWGEPRLWVLLVFSSLVDYVNGRLIGKYRGKWQARAALISSIVINLALLGCFKYLDFFTQNVNLFTGMNLPLPGLALPIGISFYTFQTLSYTIDVYRDNVKVQRSFTDFLLFVSLFPQLIAGPIVRYSDVELQINDRRMTLEGFAYGLTRFACGLGKKVLLANMSGEIAASILDGGLDTLPASHAWLGLLMYAFQIYFDFSGYSDMAIGLGSVFGFKYPENFMHPYMSRSITEFWRRWHITLGSFFRDYVYIPMGGNRRHQALNLLVVWFLTGLWHGASWNFVLWGLYYCLLLMAEKFVFKGAMEKIPSALRLLSTFFLVLLGWSLFYYTDLARLGMFLASAFGAHGFAASGSGALWLSNLPLILVCALGCTAIPGRLVKRLPEVSREAASIGYNLAMLALCTASLVGQTYNPFIYFRF